MRILLPSSLIPGVVAALVLTGPVSADELPVPCAAGSCGPTGPAVWVTEGEATGTRSGNTFTINQSTERATLNWASFDIGADGTVNFLQPGADSIALNRIFQADPSRIFGALNANGQVYLLNQNGIIFGETAVVNVGSLVASTLDLTPAAVANGILGASRQQPAAPAFAIFTDENGDPLPSGAITIEHGAFLGAEGGQIFIFAPEIANRGEISTPGGQTILAAGDRIYLAASNDESLGGLIVEVDGQGIITNGSDENAGRTPDELIGRIRAERGNVSLAALAVNQLGHISATTTVRRNGSIRLVARQGVTVRSNAGGEVELLAGEGGSLTVGEDSVTEVLLSDDDATTVDVNAQPRSFIELEGARVDVLEGARLTATGGRIGITARANPQVTPGQFDPESDDSRLYVASEAVIDVSGATVDLPIERNIVEVELRGNQLRDSPEQRDGPLRGETVRVDVRQSGVRADGTPWQGTPLADASGEISNIERGVAERSLSGGEISLSAQGDVIIAEGAVLDVSGGAITYQGGDVATSRVLGANGQLYDIAEADPDRAYVSVVDAYTVEHPRWGVTEVFQGFPADVTGQFESAYVEGKDAGSVTIISPRFVLDGEIRAETVRGRYQRLPPGKVPESSLYRPFDQVPLGAGLTIGSAAGLGVPSNFVTGSIVFADQLALDALGDELPFDSATDPLPGDFVSVVRPALMGEDRVARLSVFSNEAIEYGAETTVHAPPGSSLSLSAAEIVFGGDFTSAGGAVSLSTGLTRTRSEAGALTLTGDASVDVRGRWVNDNPLLPEAGEFLPRFIDGGTVDLTAAEGDLLVQAGSRIDVSGGAYRDAGGSIEPGRGGAVSLVAEPTADATPVDTVIEAELIGLALRDGASLSIAANTICISVQDCATDEGELWLTPDLYISGGFADIDITANLVGLELLEGTQIVAQQRNLEFDQAVTLRPSTSSLAEFTRAATLPRVDRRPVDLRLATDVTLPVAPDLGDTSSLPILLLGAGSRIDADPGATITLETTSRAVVAGRISAPAGRVEIAATRGGRPPQSGVRGIRLEEDARIDVSGTALVREDELGRRVGEVRDGGSIDLRANLGHIVLAPGSELFLDGIAADVDVAGGTAANVVFERRNVGSNGGHLTLTAAEGILFGGSFSAAGGAVAGTAGGSLSLTVDGNIRGGDPSGGSGEPAFSLQARRISLTQETIPISIAADEPVPEQFTGEARIGVDTIASSGIADLTLNAESLFGLRFGTTFLASLGEIIFDGPSELSLPGRLTLNAANLTGGGGDVRLVANTLTLGHEDPRTQAVGEALESSLGSLHAEANLIDFVGNARLRGFETAEFTSRGDIRLIGEQLTNQRELVGSLTTAADLFLTAAQIYPTTLADFTFRVDREGGRIGIAAADREAGPVFSAAGRLTLAADRITQGGVLRAPFGEIVLDARDLTFLPGSTTATSLGDALIPFGTLQGGFDWTFSLESNQTLVYDGVLNRLPQQRVSLNADAIDVQEGAVIDVSAGGDLLAYEFIPGVGGSTDFLSPEVNPGTFAILPGIELDFAPFDPAESLGTAFSAGDAVYLEGVGDLPAGVYTLLPARYALLPGAVLVTPVDGYTDILPDQRFAQLDGSVILSGRRVVNGTDFRATRTQGFALRPGSAAFQEAQYDLALATDFFAERNVRTPIDAGVLELNAGDSLAIGGRLDSSAPGGRGAEVDIVGNVLRVVDAIASIPDTVEILVEDLLALDAESILLGGVRSGNDVLEVIAERVEVASGVELTSPELIITARDTVSIEDAAVLSGSGTAAAPGILAIDGDAAFVRISGGGQVALGRANETGTTGDVLIGEGAVISGSGSVAIDASRDIQSAGTIEAEGGALRLGASAISFGDTDENIAGLLLGADALASIDAAEVELVSREAIGIYGISTLAVADSIAISAPGLAARDDAASLTLEAPEILISGRNGELGGAAASEGAVSVAGTTIDFLGGDFIIDGFAATGISAADSVLFAGEGRLAVGGDLSLTADLLASATGSDYGVAAAGNVTVSSDEDDVQPARASGLGGRLRLAGQRVTVDTLIQATSGVIEIGAAAAGDALTLGGNATLDVSGQRFPFDTLTVASPGGTVRLRAASGNIAATDGSLIDVSAPADAGVLLATASAGTLNLAGRLDGSAASGPGGSLYLDAGAFSSVAQIFTLAAEGGFSRAVHLRQRGPGELLVSDGASVTAADIALANDGGGIRVAGTLDAGSAAGGEIRLDALDVIDISGRLIAGNESGGGRIAVGSAGGGVTVRSGSVLELNGGELLVTTSREALETVLDEDAANDAVVFDGRIGSAGRFTLVGDRVYDDTDGRLTVDELVAGPGNPRFVEAQDFMARSGELAAALGQADNPAFRILPGLAIRSGTDLELTADWNLFPWRFGEAPGVLTLRAAGDLRFAGSLSDAFNTTSDGLLEYAGDSWSYRLIAGADLAAADPLAVQADPGAGSLFLAPGVPGSGRREGDLTAVRTGNGRIDVSAAGDLVFGNQASVIYTAGVATDGIRLPQRGDLGNRTYPDQGGDVEVRVGRDIIGPNSDQLFTAWLWRTGRGVDTSRPNATGWTVNFARFEQGIGALGGGNVSIRAGRDILDFSASVPSIGRQIGGTSAEDSEVELAGGGDLDILAGGDILGGSYLVGLGRGSLRADGRFGASAPTGLAPVLGIGDATVDVIARESVLLQAAVNPTLLPQSPAQQVPIDSRSYFSSYADSSAVSLRSIGGDITTADSAGAASNALNAQFELLLFGPDALALRLLPPEFSATSFDGDILIDGSLTLFPSPSGDLRLLAAEDITLGNRINSIQLILSDVDPIVLPAIDDPDTTLAGTTETILSNPNTTFPQFNARTPVHSVDAEPLRVVAREGTVRMLSPSLFNRPLLWSAKPARIAAGTDIENVSLYAQNLGPSSVTSLAAGRDIIYPNERTPDGTLSLSNRSIDIAGEGLLSLVAGRDVDLQTSAGITSRGNLRNDALAETGASISLLAGVGETPPDYSAFIDTYLAEGDEYEDELAAYLAGLGVAGGAPAENLDTFLALDLSLQVPLVEQLFFAELRASGRDAASGGETTGDFTRGFDALTTLFPGANPDIEEGEENAYQGDISLFFSRIYTLDGGDIRLLVPGGAINAGLATPPVAFGLGKSAEQLGIVVQSNGDVQALAFGDFAVNESRVFAADGGDILIWSTRGDIDAGRGAKTAISAPPPQTIINPETGATEVIFPAALTGSGIQTLATSPGVEPGDVDLFAPRGVVNAGDAGIVAGNLTVAATAVLGADNIDVSGISIGVPVDTAVAAGLTSVSAVGSSATRSAEAAVTSSREESTDDAPLADSALGWLDVFVLGFGECDPETGENCEEEDRRP